MLIFNEIQDARNIPCLCAMLTFES